MRKCKAALHSVHSRCLFLQELSLFVLPPFVEYLNHDKNPNAHWILVNGNTLVVKSRRDINPNEEVTITYGNHCNEVFAIQYFFVPKNNPNDVLYMQLRREMTCMRLAKYDGMSVDETKSNFIPFGFVEYGNEDRKSCTPRRSKKISSLEVDQNAPRIRKEHDYPDEKEAHDEED